MNKEIEKALKELEEELKWTHNDGVNLTKYDESLFNVIKQALTTKSKKEQAFDIIKEKNVNIGIVSVVGSLEQYNQTYVYDYMLNVKWCLTKEEFDLLKEVLNDNSQE